ncbi:hypothetical protein M758_11G009000 [Ceratodon purpureus]|nr:hypothetical protein M758_11G009000 [Ceratodon purpureus]
MAAAVWDLQRCTFCCSCGSLASTAGCSRVELSGVAGQSLRSGFPVGGLLKLSLRRRFVGKQLRNGAVTRSLYSPLVESFENAKRNSSNNLNSENNLNDSGAWRTSSPTDTPTEDQEQAGPVVNEAEGGDDSNQSTPQDPSTAAYGDGAHAEKLADIGHDIDVKKGARGRARARARPPSMSLSQGFSSVGRRAVSHTVGAVGHPLRSKVPGPIGFVMAFAVAVLGVKTAVEKQGLLPGTPQKICEKCDGYGVQQCHVCKGRGVLTWEGKLLHKNDPCPLCFGRCVKKVDLFLFPITNCVVTRRFSCLRHS